MPIERTVEEILLAENRPQQIKDAALTRRWSMAIDRKFDDLSLRFPITQADFLDLPGGPEGILEDVKLTVLEVYPGADNAPLAISEIYAFGINGKK